MFGYLTADVLALDKENRKLYKSFYCGLCEELNKKYGNIGRLTLSYDLTFVGILLTDLYNEEIITLTKHCPIHPLTKIEAKTNKYFEFAADMNILLSYYKCLDDVDDDKSSLAKLKASKLLPFVEKIQMRYPNKCEIVKDCLQQIKEIENKNILNPDLPANCFGQLMSEILYVENDEMMETLKGFGFHLGRFIYLMDAVCDLKKDLKSSSYNPLVMVSELTYDSMLQLVLEEADYFYKKLELSTYNTITDNVMYAGLWVKYDQKKTLERKKSDERSL